MNKLTMKKSIAHLQIPRHNLSAKLLNFSLECYPRSKAAFIVHNNNALNSKIVGVFDYFPEMYISDEYNISGPHDLITRVNKAPSYKQKLPSLLEI